MTCRICGNANVHTATCPRFYATGTWVVSLSDQTVQWDNGTSWTDRDDAA